MGLVNIKAMLKKAKKENYAVGQFNTNNLEWTIAIIKEAQKLNSPLIIGVSEGAAKYMGGYLVIVEIIKALIKTQNITIDVAIHLDHGSSFEECKKAIDAGFTSVMIDASAFPLKENIRITKKVVDYAKKHNVSVEAELGRVGGQEDTVKAKIIYADPNECRKMVEETKIDALAPALGSVHGPYKGEPKIGFEEMEVISNLVKIPLVLHGGSGIPDYQIKKAIKKGTAKINVNTECKQEWTKVVREVLNKDIKVYDPRKIIGPGMEGIRKVVNQKIKLFGSEGKN